MIERTLPKLSVGAQCRLLSISRSSFYYAPQGETALNLDLGAGRAGGNGGWERGANQPRRGGLAATEGGAPMCNAKRQHATVRHTISRLSNPDSPGRSASHAL